jgi:hypothetical protein
MTKYMIGVWYPEGGTPPPPDELEVIMSGVQGVHEDMAKAGVWVFGGALHGPDASTVVRATGADVLVTDGPYVETKEQLGGFSIVDVADLDEALVWAGRLAHVLVPLSVEVRPFQD